MAKKKSQDTFPQEQRHAMFYELQNQAGLHLGWAKTDAECKAKAEMLIAQGNTKIAVYQRIGQFEPKEKVSLVFKKEPR